MAITLESAIMLLGGAGTFVTLLVFARQDGKREGKMAALSENVARRLDDFSQLLGRVDVSLAEAAQFRVDDAGWKATIAGRVERAEADIKRTRDNYHNDVAPKVQRAIGLEDRVRNLEQQRAS